jgi:hypothetical protein
MITILLGNSVWMVTLNIHSPGERIACIRSARMAIRHLAPLSAGQHPRSNVPEQPSILLERGPRLIELRSMWVAYISSPKPSGLGMVSTPNIAATIGEKSFWGDVQARRDFYGNATTNGHC